MFTRPPLVTIITVVYNSAYLLEGSVKSVLAQTYPHIEYIIVDGASTDHTHTILQLAEISNHKLLNAKMLRWISEPDNGLYDAMNKGLRMATGDFVWFLNAGDQLFEPQTVEKIMMQCTPETDVLYGEVMLVTYTRRHLGTRSDLTTQKLPEYLDWKSLLYGMVVCHQAFVPRRAIAPSYITNNLAADIDWVIEVLKKSRKNVHTHLILAEYLQGGLSKQRHRQSLKDRYVVLKKHYGKWPNLWAHFRILIRAVFHNKNSSQA
jgi:glycosyltransferase involved in cell wall biosynthesis